MQRLCLYSHEISYCVFLSGRSLDKSLVFVHTLPADMRRASCSARIRRTGMCRAVCKTTDRTSRTDKNNTPPAIDYIRDSIKLFDLISDSWTPFSDIKRLFEGYKPSRVSQNV